MIRLLKSITFVLVVLAASSLVESRVANAQVAVTTYYPAQPVVGYMPVRRGLFGLRRGYVPVVSYAAPSAVTSYYVPSAPVVTNYAPVAPTTTYYVPSAPTTTYYVPSAPTTTYYVPSAPVTTYYAPAAPVVSAPVTTYYPGTVVIGP